jgi:hypothetical protein
MVRYLGTAALALALGLGGASIVEAQSLGTFRWQLQPYCNVVSVTVTQNGELFTLDGYDDQCGDPATVKYHVLPSLLLAEVQRLERERASAEARATAQGDEIVRLRDALKTLQTAFDTFGRAVERR